jgi:integrase
MFFLKDKTKDTTILAIVRFKGERFKISTGEKVPFDCWLPDKDMCKVGRMNPTGADVNLRLGIWKKHIETVVSDFAMLFKVPTQEEFNAAVKAKVLAAPVSIQSNGFVDFARRHKISCDKAPGTKKVYQTTINWLEKYEKAKGTVLQFADIDDQFYKKFKSYVYKSDLINSPNTFGTLIKNIKVFMNCSGKLHQITTHKSSDFKKVDAEADNIYLTVDELVKIHQTVINEEFIRKQFGKIKINNVNQKIKALELSRGKFLIGAFTALRVSDFTRIEELNIKDNIIRIRTDKNDYPVVIPVHWVVREILDGGFNLSEKISDQKINKQIKILCKYTGITTPTLLTKFEAGKRIDTIKPKCDWVTTHTARRSGATNMFKAGIPSISIMKITGHRTEKSFLKYIKITQEENAQLLAGHAFFKKEVKITEK